MPRTENMWEVEEPLDASHSVLRAHKTEDPVEKTFPSHQLMKNQHMQEGPSEFHRMQITAKYLYGVIFLLCL